MKTDKSEKACYKYTGSEWGQKGTQWYIRHKNTAIFQTKLGYQHLHKFKMKELKMSDVKKQKYKEQQLHQKNQ